MCEVYCGLNLYVIGMPFPPEHLTPCVRGETPLGTGLALIRDRNIVWVLMVKKVLSVCPVANVTFRFQNRRAEAILFVSGGGIGQLGL